MTSQSSPLLLHQVSRERLFQRHSNGTTEETIHNYITMEAFLRQLSQAEQQKILEQMAARKPSETTTRSLGVVTPPVAPSSPTAPQTSSSHQSRQDKPKAAAASIAKNKKSGYRDHSKVMPPPGYKEPTDITLMNFAEKLHHILSRSDLESIIEWRPHGRAFKVYVPQLFALHVCPEYFGHQNYARFCNDLKEHGFIKIPNGLDQNGKCVLCF